MDRDAPLFIDYCGQDAATYAVKNWHYSGGMPAGKIVRYGVWEHGEFIGAVIYGLGASPHTYKRYGLLQGEGCELVRVALRKHEAPVTRIVAITLRILKRDFPGIKLVISFADPTEGHHGGIYQGGNWIYTGTSKVGAPWAFIVNGRKRIWRSMCARYPAHLRPGDGNAKEGILAAIRKYEDPKAVVVESPPKHRYVQLISKDPRLIEMVKNMARPYPKKTPSASEASHGDAPSVQEGEGGSNPTPTHTEEAGA